MEENDSEDKSKEVVILNGSTSRKCSIRVVLVLSRAVVEGISM